MSVVDPVGGRMQVRRVEPAEFAAVGELALDAYRADGLVTDSDEDNYPRRLRDTAARDAEAEVLVAVGDSGQVLGTVTWCPPGSTWRELATRADQAEFRMLAVPPSGRGRGVAGALVDACLARARAEGMGEMLLSSKPEMRAAHALYLARGFVRAPEYDHRPVPSVQLWAFRLELSPVVRCEPEGIGG